MILPLANTNDGFYRYTWEWISFVTYSVLLRFILKMPGKFRACKSSKLIALLLDWPAVFLLHWLYCMQNIEPGKGCMEETSTPWQRKAHTASRGLGNYNVSGPVGVQDGHKQNLCEMLQSAKPCASYKCRLAFFFSFKFKNKTEHCYLHLGPNLQIIPKDWKTTIFFWLWVSFIIKHSHSKYQRTKYRLHRMCLCCWSNYRGKLTASVASQLL